MTNKKFKLAAMSLATAVAVSAVGPSASAVTYYLGDGSVTVDKDDTRGAYSYQGAGPLPHPVQQRAARRWHRCFRHRP